MTLDPILSHAFQYFSVLFRGFFKLNGQKPQEWNAECHLWDLYGFMRLARKGFLAIPKKNTSLIPWPLSKSSSYGSVQETAAGTVRQAGGWGSNLAIPQWFTDSVGSYHCKAGDLMGIYSDLMGIYGDLMGIYSDLMGIYGDLMGY